jgi:hypothetical protein
VLVIKTDDGDFRFDEVKQHDRVYIARQYEEIVAEIKEKQRQCAFDHWCLKATAYIVNLSYDGSNADFPTFALRVAADDHPAIMNLMRKVGNSAASETALGAITLYLARLLV